MLPQGIFSVADRDGPLPDPGAVRGPRRPRRPAGDDGERDAADPAAARPRDRRDPGPLRADDPARLRARRVRRRVRPSWSPRRSSGSPSRCPSTASSCSSPAPSSASSGPGCRPRSRAGNLVITAGVALLLYEPYGVGGIVAATVIATIAASSPRRGSCAARSAGSSSGGCSGAARASCSPRPRSPGSPTSSGRSSTTRSAAAWAPRSSRSASRWRPAALAYVAAVLALRVPEASQALRVIRRR